MTELVYWCNMYDCWLMIYGKPSPLSKYTKLTSVWTRLHDFRGTTPFEENIKSVCIGTILGSCLLVHAGVVFSAAHWISFLWLPVTFTLETWTKNKDIELKSSRVGLCMCLVSHQQHILTTVQLERSMGLRGLGIHFIKDYNSRLPYLSSRVAGRAIISLLSVTL